MIALKSPFTEDKIRALKVGNEVEITGVLFTGRDAVHKYLHEGGALPSGVNLRDGILYHCGPVMLRDDRGEWKVVAAGPTTSIREEPYQAQIIRDLGLRGVIGKGGMGDRTLAACREYASATKQIVFIEYLMIEGVNDAVSDAHRLAGKLRGLPCRINLLPYNAVPNLPYRCSPETSIQIFKGILAKAGFRTLVRSSRGADISAACGQLAATEPPGTDLR